MKNSLKEKFNIMESGTGNPILISKRVWNWIEI